jgi:hypothetical protein
MFEPPQLLGEHQTGEVWGRPSFGDFDGNLRQVSGEREGRLVEMADRRARVASDQEAVAGDGAVLASDIG